MLTPFVSTASPLAPWSAPPAPTGFTSRPPSARGLPSWWHAALLGAVALTLAIMALRAALFLGWIRV